MSLKDVIHAIPEGAKLIVKYKKLILTMAPLWAAFIWGNQKMNYFQEKLRIVDSVPILEKKFSEWATEIDSTNHQISIEITTIKHAMLGELKARKIGSLKLFLNNNQQEQERPSGGFIYNSSTEGLDEVFWSDAAEDYFIYKKIKKIKNGTSYSKKIKVFLGYDD